MNQLINGFFFKKNGDAYVDYDYEMGEGEYKMVEAVKLQITNKDTNKTAQKRCFQGYSVLEDVQYDLLRKKSKFSKIFKKIDK